MMNPPIRTLFPVPTAIRVERFRREPVKAGALVNARTSVPDLMNPLDPTEMA
jgi:hypothetical protein